MHVLYIGTEFAGPGRLLDSGFAESVIAQIKLAALDRFGGYSASLVDGAWKNEKGATVFERALRLEVSTDNLHEVWNFARQCADLMHQNCVLVASPGRADEWIYASRVNL